MFVQLATDLAVTQGTNAFSPSVALGGLNSVRHSVTIVNLNGATNLATTLEGSNDNAFWETIGSALTQTTVSTQSLENKNITFAYVRLKYAVTGAAITVICSANLYGSVQ